MTFRNGLSQTRLESSATETITESHLSYFNLILNYKKTRNLQKKYGNEMSMIIMMMRM